MLSSKKNRIIAFLVILIVVPILYHIVSDKISDYNQRKAAGIPQEVQTITPVSKAMG